MSLLGSFRIPERQKQWGWGRLPLPKGRGQASLQAPSPAKSAGQAMTRFAHTSGGGLNRDWILEISY